MKFVPPLLIILFAATMSGVWMLDTRRRHMLFFGLGFATFAAGLLLQVLQLLPGLNAAVFTATALYLLAGLFFCEAVMLRLDKQFSPFAGASISVLTLAVIGYLAQVGADYKYMAVASNFGLGAMIATLCLQSRALMQGKWIERTLHGFLTILAAHFFLRSILTVKMLSGISTTEQLIRSQYWTLVTISVSFIGVLLGLVILVVATADVINELQAERDSDPLTGALNRRGLERAAKRSLMAAEKNRLAVIIADIDHFKAINDEFGHSIGDQVLVEFSSLLRSASEKGAIVGRVGGEEFVLIVKGGAEQCEIFANRLCSHVARYSFSMLPNGRSVTSSFGLAVIRDHETVWDAAARADLALLRVKRRGRNRVAAEGVEFKSAGQIDYLLTA
ncbi:MULTISPECIES: GGDEF domain-containing protein [Brucella]|uniref:diguanylate cyclase n=1 Tax=Brucella pseudogrignonensis TaxID=419475 RepID=A0A256GI25_9HYPH|nr:GGDEF domain-containing protein [Brucella pseudogrignonensis]NNV19561.1 GGDEF domain-containing protein [Brucella pseudogrignonensis]OYR26590.1 diguanylate cyclase domain protein [Brucella pseudogrignonensis]